MTPSSNRQTRIVVFAKAPEAGNAKTRLIPALGAQGAATLARHLLGHTLERALAAKLGPVELCVSPAASDAAWRLEEMAVLASALEWSDQGQGDLGQRMALAVKRLTPAQPVLLIGTDCPGLSTELLQAAARNLATHDAVMLPASDGGYVLLGLKAPCPEIFSAMPWSTDTVAALSLQRMADLGMRVWLGPLQHDIDEPADLKYLPPALATLCIRLDLPPA